MEKKLKFADFADTVFDENNREFAKVEILGYLELGLTISSLINVCRAAVESETDIVNGLEISRVLGIAASLVPYSEMDYLEKLKYAERN